MELGTKVCNRCGRKLRPGSTRCAACNVNLYRRTPRLLTGMFLVLMFAAFCAALYFFMSRQIRAIALLPVLWTV
jgi:hypothetical protein